MASALSVKPPLCLFAFLAGGSVVVTSLGGWTIVSLALFSLLSFLCWLGYGAYLLSSADAEDQALSHMGCTAAALVVLFGLLAMPLFFGVSISGRGGLAVPEEWVTKGLSSLSISAALAYGTLRMVRSRVFS